MLCVLVNALHALVLFDVWLVRFQSIVFGHLVYVHFVFWFFIFIFFIYVHFECVKLPFIKCLLCIRDCEAFYID